MNDEQRATWQELLREAVRKPGTISKAYTAFYGYSAGNQLLAMWQCAEREIEPGPIATYKAWRERGRHVKHGEHALSLAMPVQYKVREHVTDNETGEETEEEHVYTKFVYPHRWFVLSQTEGAEYKPEPVPGWNPDTVLRTLDIALTGFAETDGNMQGYSVDRSVAVSPIAVNPNKTLFHEVAHVLLGHTAEDGHDASQSLREAEAESVALICCESLGLEGADDARGYIQAWYGHNDIPEKSARRILRAADAILRAGRDKPDKVSAEV